MEVNVEVGWVSLKYVIQKCARLVLYLENFSLSPLHDTSEEMTHRCFSRPVRVLREQRG